jgi:hypothetical protein
MQVGLIESSGYWNMKRENDIFKQAALVMRRK